MSHKTVLFRLELTIPLVPVPSTGLGVSGVGELNFKVVTFLANRNERFCFAGVLAVGIFAENPFPLDTTHGRSGLIKGMPLNANIVFFQNIIQLTLLHYKRS